MAAEQKTQTSDDIVKKIQALAPAGSAVSPDAFKQLQAATQDLICVLKTEGKLDESPAALALNRTLDLHRDAAEARIKGQKILITGGLGSVGARLIPLLFNLGAGEISIVDIADEAGSPWGSERDPAAGIKPSVHKVDIRDSHALEGVFAEFKPQIVFHLASIREPGRAEAVVREAIETNVFGTRNVINACLKHGVEDAIYSSTGKCFAYVSDHVYTGSKKLAEAQWVVAARCTSQARQTRFRCTRFTHVMENGVVAQDITDGIANGLVGLHGPDRYFNIQNLRQATHLLINAVALSEQTLPDGFWSAVDLGWPVNTLELALYNINLSGKPVAIRFLGVPKGYDEAFFRGQFCWDGETEYHPLINAIEAPTGFTDSTGTMVGARVPAFEPAALEVELDGLEAALGNVSLDVVQIKQALIDAVGGLAQAVFAAADLTRLIDILWWGAAREWAGPQAQEATRFSMVIGLLSNAIIKGLNDSHSPLSAEARHKLLDVVQTLARVESLRKQADALSAFLTTSAPLPDLSLVFSQSATAVSRPSQKDRVIGPAEFSRID